MSNRPFKWEYLAAQSTEFAKNAPERQKWLQLSIGVVNARWLSLWAEEIVRTGSGDDSKKLKIL